MHAEHPDEAAQRGLMLLDKRPESFLFTVLAVQIA